MKELLQSCGRCGLQPDTTPGATSTPSWWIAHCDQFEFADDEEEAVHRWNLSQTALRLHIAAGLQTRY